MTTQERLSEYAAGLKSKKRKAMVLAAIELLNAKTGDDLLLSEFEYQGLIYGGTLTDEGKVVMPVRDFSIRRAPEPVVEVQDEEEEFS